MTPQDRARRIVASIMPAAMVGFTVQYPAAVESVTAELTAAERETEARVWREVMTMLAEAERLLAYDDPSNRYAFDLIRVHLAACEVRATEAERT